jgi:hypothetical protein
MNECSKESFVMMTHFISLKLQFSKIDHNIFELFRDNYSRNKSSFFPFLLSHSAGNQTQGVANVKQALHHCAM